MTHLIYFMSYYSFFGVNQVCQMLGYNNIKQALSINVEKKNILSLRDIVPNYKILYKNVQGSTKFLSEAELYSLILKR